MSRPCLLLVLAVACSGPGSSSVDAGLDAEAPSIDAPDPGTVDAPAAVDEAAWIIEHFTDAPTITGPRTARTLVETPAVVRDASGCCAKYAFDIRAAAAPEAGFVNVAIAGLESTDAFGGGLKTQSGEGMTLFLAGVTIDPMWPAWVDYATTNFDGIVLDGSAAFFAADLTVTNWNADAAIDNKAEVSQLVRFTMSGHGNRGIRYWRPGPHYIVDSTLANTGDLGAGTVLWFSNCDTVSVKVYRSTFLGSPTIPASAIECDAGSNPDIEYLTTDPRTTGEMHPMFSYVPATAR